MLCCINFTGFCLGLTDGSVRYMVYIGVSLDHWTATHVCLGFFYAPCLTTEHDPTDGTDLCLNSQTIDQCPAWDLPPPPLLDNVLTFIQPVQDTRPGCTHASLPKTGSPCFTTTNVTSSLHSRILTGSVIWVVLYCGHFMP